MISLIPQFPAASVPMIHAAAVTSDTAARIAAFASIAAAIIAALAAFFGARASARSARLSAQVTAEAARFGTLSESFYAIQMHKREVYCSLLSAAREFTDTTDPKQVERLSRALDDAYLCGYRELRQELKRLRPELLSNIGNDRVKNGDLLRRLQIDASLYPQEVAKLREDPEKLQRRLASEF